MLKQPKLAIWSELIIFYVSFNQTIYFSDIKDTTREDYPCVES